MNSLMWIGGGWIWYLICCVLSNTFLTKESNKKVGEQRDWFNSLAYVMIWIWICWRFIR